MGFVTVNSKSLVVIPKAVRDRARIYPGDKLKVAYDEESSSVVMRKISAVRSISEVISGIWKDNDFSLKEIRESRDERLDKLLKDKLYKKRGR